MFTIAYGNSKWTFILLSNEHLSFMCLIVSFQIRFLSQTSVLVSILLTTVNNTQSEHKSLTYFSLQKESQFPLCCVSVAIEWLWCPSNWKSLAVNSLMHKVSPTSPLTASLSGCVFTQEKHKHHKWSCFPLQRLPHSQVIPKHRPFLFSISFSFVFMPLHKRLSLPKRGCMWLISSKHGRANTYT